ncbi:MAG: AsmA family protein [Magnetococcales bacterium]|nr:AsmA family protein [Magnetococcales bacterium]
MNKWLLIPLSVVMLLVAALAAIPLLVDPNQYKQEIAALVKEKTGRELLVNGPIGLSLFPWVGVTLSEVTLGDAPGFGADPMAKVSRLEVRAKLAPLLSKRLEADKIAIDGLTLKLAKDAKGRTNWDDLTGAPAAQPTREAAPASAKAPSPAKPATKTSGQDAPKEPVQEVPKEAAPVPVAPASENGAGLAGFAIGGVEIRNAQVSWSDGVSGTKYALKGLKLITGAVAPGRPVAVELDTDVESSKPAANAHVSLTTTVHPSADGKSFKLQKSKLGVALKGGKGLPVASAELQLAAEIEAALDGSLLKLSGLDAFLKTEGGETPLAKSETKLQGTVDLSPTQGTIRGVVLTVKAEGKPGAGFASLEAQLKGDAEGQMKTRRFQSPRLEMSVKASGGGLPGGGAELRLIASGEADLIQQTARLSAIQLEGLEQLKAEGAVSLTKLLDDPQATGELTLRPFNLRTLLTQLGQQPPVTADDKSLTALSLKASFKADDNRLEVSQLHAKLDDSTLQGSFSLANYGLPAVRFDLSADALDLDRYLPPKSEAGAADKKGTGVSGEKETVKTSSAAGGGGEIPVKLLRLLDVDGKMKLGLLKAGGGHFKDAHLVIQAKDGLLRLEPAQVKLYEGSARVDATLDVRGDTPKLTVKQDLQGVKLESLLQEMAQDDSLAGVANLNMDLTASGKTVEALKQGMDGRISFNIKDGAYQKMDLTHAIRQAYGVYATAKGRTMVVGKDTGRTPFTTLEGSAVIQNGVLETKNLQAVSPALKLTGGGKADWPRNQLDFTTRVSLLTALEDVDSKSINDLKGVEIPVKIHGELTHPQTTVDLTGLVEQALKTKAMEKVQEKLGGKLQEKLGGGAGKALGDELQKIFPFGR